MIKIPVPVARTPFSKGKTCQSQFPFYPFRRQDPRQFLFELSNFYSLFQFSFLSVNFCMNFLVSILLIQFPFWFVDFCLNFINFYSVCSVFVLIRQFLFEFYKFLFCWFNWFVLIRQFLNFLISILLVYFLIWFPKLYSVGSISVLIPREENLVESNYKNGIWNRILAQMTSHNNYKVLKPQLGEQIILGPSIMPLGVAYKSIIDTEFAPRFKQDLYFTWVAFRWQIVSKES